LNRRRREKYEVDQWKRATATVYVDYYRIRTGTEYPYGLFGVERVA